MHIKSTLCFADYSFKWLKFHFLKFRAFRDFRGSKK